MAQNMSGRREPKWGCVIGIVLGVFVLLPVPMLVAVPVVRHYEFVEAESTVLRYGGRGPIVTYVLVGYIELTVDTDEAWAGVTGGEAVLLGSGRLDGAILADFLHTEQLESVFVSASDIRLFYDRGVPSFPGMNIAVNLTFDGDVMNMTAAFDEAPVPDGYWYDVQAVAVSDQVSVPEPATVLLMGAGLAALVRDVRRRNVEGEVCDV